MPGRLCAWAPTFHHATVTEITSVTPRMRRIELSGAELTGYPCDGPGAHLKLLLAPPGSREILLPSAGPDGLRWPDGLRPLARTYTPRRVDGWKGRLAIDFALHDDGGPATAWASTAQQDEQVVVSGARGSYRVGQAVPDAQWTLLIADETASPLVASILEDAPASTRVLVIAEIACPGEELSSRPPLTSPQPGCTALTGSGGDARRRSCPGCRPARRAGCVLGEAGGWRHARGTAAPA